MPAAFPRVFLALAFVLAPVTATLANGIRIADDPALPTFTSLQAAVDAAQEGNLLLVAPGNYGAATVDGKSLSIVAMPNGAPHMTGLTVRNLGSAQRVLVSGLTIEGGSTPGVTLRDDAGDVRFQSCVIRGGRVQTSGSSSFDFIGMHGIDAQTSTRVVLASCQVFGADSEVDAGDFGFSGGHAVASLGSNFVLYDCWLAGGMGAAVSNPGGPGGDGFHIENGGLFASGTTFTAGVPGRGDWLGCVAGGVGGDGVDATNAQVKLLDVLLQPTAGGPNGCGGSQAPSGSAVRNTGSLVNMVQGSHRTLVAAALVSDAAFVTINVTGQPGDRFYLVRAFTTGFAWQSQFHGTWTIPANASAIARGIIPASGSLTMQVRTPDIIGPDHRPQILQGFCVDPLGSSVLTGPVHIEILDAAGGPDCNGDGVNDLVEILDGTISDANQNLVPDGCPGG